MGREQRRKGLRAYGKTADVSFTLKEMNAAYNQATKGHDTSSFICFPNVAAYNKAVELCMRNMKPRNGASNIVLDRLLFKKGELRLGRLLQKKKTREKRDDK